VSTEVVMPQMGESIAEGTIVRWIKKVGDPIDKDEPLFEISTDKVDAEIPSPGAGVVLEIKVKEGETVPVNSVVAVIGAAGSHVAPAPAATAQSVQKPAATPAAHQQAAPVAPTAAVAPGVPVVSESAPATLADLRRQKSSPVVRNIAKAHGIDIRTLNGTGISGRVTKKDIQSFIDSGVSVKPAPGAPSAPAIAPPPAFKPGENVRIEKMGIMRKKIADHMVMSLRTSPHVYSAYEVDFSRIDEIRKKKKAEYDAVGAKLTYTAFIAKATIDTIRQFPFSNASIDGENVVYHKDVNIGIAVALDWGLIVPVVKNADEKNLLGLSRAVADLANRARAKQLKPDEVQGGTFTITNPGVFGALLGTPIINQPQVAILGVGAVEKRPVVVDDAIAIRPMAYLTLGYDHRLIDGAVADQYMSIVKRTLEHWDPNVV